MTRAHHRFFRIGAVMAIAAVASAHIGSPNVFLTGKAGPYDVTVIVRPPDVVPGLAEITVRVPAGSDVDRVLVRPVHWTTGSAGAPAADTTERLDAPEPTFAGKLWLMSHGAYTVQVSVEGARGAGSVNVPVAAVATARRTLGPVLTVVLIVLGTILVVGMATIVRAAASDALVPPGEQLGASRRRRGRIAMAIALPVLILAIVGGWRWWSAEASEYERTLYRPLAVASSVTPDVGGHKLTFTITDSVWRAGGITPIIPDHGKLLHLFVVRAGLLDAFAHLHPSQTDAGTFVTSLPPLPAGSYHVFADLVHESGFERTLVTKVEIPQPARGTTWASASLDPDDGWSVGNASTAAAGPSVRVRLADGSMLGWHTQDQTLVAGRETMLRFEVTDASGAPAELEPYLGMSAHAVVTRDDGSVFVHLHPMGTVTLAAQQAFALRDRGDTTEKGRLKLPDSTRASHHVDVESSFAFPYAFPREGRYRMWVQVRRGGAVLTGAFVVVVVPASPGGS